MRIHKILSLAATAAIVAGCSGGSSSPVAPLARATPAALPAGVAKNATRLTFTIPNHSNSKRYAIGSRKPKYVSPSTAGVFATVTSTTMASPTPQYQGYSLAPNTTATTANPVTCGAQSDTGYTCTLYGNLAPDSYTITLVATDAAESGNTGTKPVGNALSGRHRNADDRCEYFERSRLHAAGASCAASTRRVNSTAYPNSGRRADCNAVERSIRSSA